MTLVDDLGLDDLPSGPKAPELTRRPDRFSPQRRLVALVPGVAAAAVIAALASVLGGLVPVVGAPVFAIVAGIIVAAYRPPAERLRPGLVFSTKAVLQGSIVVLGLGLSAGQVVSTGESSLPVLLGTLVTALGMAWLVGRALHLGPRPEHPHRGGHRHLWGLCHRRHRRRHRRRRGRRQLRHCHDLHLQCRRRA